ncbi:tyrosine-type recombinase/integrase [Aeoliella mucimassa]|uniref:tyrosine-type recombinase/integrase n=1 Tax=Aeoliella mucimassa TaxID=2527972 RepID=UPI0018D4B4FD
MASIEYRARSTRVVAYVNKEKKTFALGEVSKKAAVRFANNIDTLLHERRCNLPLSRDVSNWLADWDDALFELLAEEGLVEPRVKAGALASYIDSYIVGRSDVTERRLGKFRNARARLIEFFGDVKVEVVTPGSADDYARWLLTRLAPATAQKECQIAAQFFRHAFRQGLIERNPFDGVTVGKATNNERRVFLSRDVIGRVLEKCPNWQWRLVLSLARYGGLRCSSEIALLKWCDIHWDADRFTITSPKTRRYGKETRVVPIFPELRPFLDDAYFSEDADKTWVVPMLGGKADKNLGTTFRKIIRRAGTEPWPKPFQNCRSSRQTELEQIYPTYVVCAWLGNTPTIAHKHYLIVTDGHFKMAVEAGDKLGTRTPVSTRHDSQKRLQSVHSVRENTSFSEVVGIMENTQVAEEGFEPPTRGL